MSFWTNNPCVPTWSSLLNSWWSTAPTRLLCTSSWRPTIKPIHSLLLRRAGVEDARPICEFWNRFYSTSASAKCFLPVDLFCQRVLKGVWEVFVVVHTSGEIVGTITRRWMQEVQIQGASLPRAGFVDYFCVHPGWRKKGVGNWLLGTLHTTAGTPCPPHFFLWEGWNRRIPSFCTGVYSSKRGVADGMCPLVPKEALPDAWRSIQTTIRSGFHEPDDIVIYDVKGTYVAIWNTFHRSIPDGEKIGIVLGSPPESAVEFVLQHGHFGVLLRTSTQSGWAMDSPYQWVAYNLQTNSLLHDFPLF